jgi:hypothetical protein
VEVWALLLAKLTFGSVRFRWTKFQTKLQGELQGIHEAGTYKSERIITSAQKSAIQVSSREQPVINFCANNCRWFGEPHRSTFFSCKWSWRARSHCFLISASLSLRDLV